MLRRLLLRAWRGRDASGAHALGQLMVFVLLPVSWLFAALTTLRQTLYRYGICHTHTLAVPVVVVGNVMAGGVGKTPITIALVNHLKAQGWRVGVLSRGYGRQTKGTLAVSPRSDARDVGDEPLLIARACNVPVFVGSNRVEAGRTLLAQHPEVQVLICDDGLQHLALGRDIELCVFDERGSGNGHLLPAGPLREAWPRRPLRHAQSGQEIPCLVVKTSGHALPDEFRVTRHLADYALQADGTQRPLQQWHNTPVQALAGIAKPESFFSMLRDQGLTLTRTHALPDHAELHTLDIDPEYGDVLCTEKDAVKLWANAPHAWAVPLHTTLPTALSQAIDTHLVAARRAKLSSAHG